MGYRLIVKTDSAGRPQVAVADGLPANATFTLCGSERGDGSEVTLIVVSETILEVSARLPAVTAGDAG
jgi:hypothetical protein